MINVSTQLKKESLTNRNYYVTANVTLSDGTTLKLGKKDFYLSGNSLVDSADSGDFPVGVAIEKTASLSLVNDDGRFDDYNFNGARFVIFLNLQLSDKLETIKRGTYIVSKKPATASEISLSLLDKMHNTDKTYDSNLSFPCTVKELLSECCQQCGITLGDVTFPNADFQIQKAPSNATYRTVIGMCAGIAGGNARIDENDLLRIITFDKTFTNTTVYDGGAVKNWTNGDDLDGGTLNPWTTGTVVDGGTLNNNDYHALFSIQNLQYDVDDIIVTGVKYVEDETEYMSGQDGYVITIDNQLLSGNAQAGVEAIGNQLIGLRMRPFSCDGIANGYATFGDPVEFIDTKNRVFRSFATDIEFVFGGSTSWSCSAKSAEEDTSEFIGEQQVAVEQSKKDIEKKLSAYDVKLKQMNELAANTLGFFYTEEIQEDGSVITYRHDKPTLADSKIIYKTGVAGFFLSIDGGQTWKAGFDSNGDAVLNILYAIGIQSEWINTRGLTAKDNEGNITFRVDAGTGRIDIIADSFMLRGKTVEELAQSELNNFVSSVFNDTVTNLQAQIDGQIESFYYDYEPLLTNEPASTWESDIDKIKHEGDLFYWKSKGFAYRFMKEGDGWKWQLVQDTDITKAMEQAAKAQDTADGKRRVFTSTPQPPYDAGDLWATSTEDGKASIKICKAGRDAGSFSSDDWIDPKYVDGTDVDDAITEYDTSLGQTEVFNKLTNGGSNKGIYIEDGELYINASYILSGVLAGKLINGKGLNVTDKNNQVTLKIDDDGNVYIKATEFSLEGKNISDVVAEESDKFRTLNVILSNEYQGIPTDKDGGYTSFPSCSTTVKVLYGSEDVTKTSIIEWSASSGVYGSSSGETYIVTGLRADTGTVKVTVTRGSLTAEKIFAIAKQKQGIQGIQGQTGATGATGNGISSITTYYLASAYSSGIYTSTSGWTTSVQSPTTSKPYLWSYQITYYTNGGSSSTSPHIIGVRGSDGADAGDLTQKQIFNILTNNGQTQGIYLQNGHLYINASYIKSGQISADLINLKNINVTNSSGTSTFAIDDYGNVTLRPNTFALTNGDTIYSVAEDKASTALSSANSYTDNALSNLDIGKMSKQEIIDVLSDNSSNKGLYLSNGNVYMNADYINTGELAGWEVGYKKLSASGTYGEVTLDASTGEIYSETNTGIYVPGYGTLYGTRIRGINLYTGVVHASSVSLSNSVSAGDSVSASGKVKAGTHIEASGHFYSVGTGTDLADASIRGKLKVSGTKSRSVSTVDYDEQLFYCYEMPTPFFGDIGESVISDDGTCMIDIDDIFQESANVGIKYYVFLQREGEGDCWIAEKEQNYFIVKGTPGLKFSFEIKARQAEYEHMRFTDPGDTAYTDARDIEIPEPNYESEEAEVSEPDYESELINDRLSIINQMEVIL